MVCLLGFVTLTLSIMLTVRLRFLGAGILKLSMEFPPQLYADNLKCVCVEILVCFCMQRGSQLGRSGTSPD